MAPGIDRPEPESEPGGGRLASRAIVIALSMAGYVAASHLLGEQYPFGPLSMFSDGLRITSRIVARRGDGQLCELSGFDRFGCEGPVDFRARSNPRCPPLAEHAESDRKAEGLIRASQPPPAGQGEPVTIVRRVFRPDGPGGPMRVDDCPLVTCTARPVEGACASTR